MPPPNTPEEGLPSASEPPFGAQSRPDPENMDHPGDQTPALESGNAAAPAGREGHTPASADAPVENTKPILDWQALDYVGEVNQTLCCPICHMPLVRPVMTRCGHVFCKGCFDEMLEHSNCCPLDRKSLARDIAKGRCPAKEAPRIYQNQLDELLVRCPNRHCPCTKSRSSIQRHYEEECGYTVVPCPDPSCARRIARMDLEGAAGECRHSVVDCPDCGQPIDVDTVDDHYENHCTLAPAACENCGVTVLKHRYAAHLLHECDGAIRPCQYHVEGCRHSCRRADLADHEQGCPFGAISRLKLLFETKVSQQNTTILQLEQSLQQQGRFIMEIVNTGEFPGSPSSGLIPNTAVTASTSRQDDGSLHRNNPNPDSSRREVAPSHTRASLQPAQSPLTNEHALESGSPSAEATGSSGDEPEGMSLISQGRPPDAGRHRHHHHRRSDHEDGAQAFLLAGLNSCEERVALLQRRLAEQDARHSLMLVNEVVPLQEQLSELRSAFAGIVMDMRYVIARQKSLMSGGGNGGTGTGSSSMGTAATSGSGLAPAPGPSGQRSGEGRTRDSDSRDSALPTITPPRL